MKFSIIIPAYKVEGYVAETVRSVLAQTCADLECIAVDDGSPDGTGRVLDELAREDARLRVIHKVNGGVSSARNAGIETAQGEWLLFLDGDDILAPNTLAVLSDAMKRHPDVDFFKFGFVDFPDGQEVDLGDALDAGERRVDISARIELADLYVYMWQFAYRRRMVGDLRFNLTYHRMEDRPFVCDCLLNRNRVFVDVGYDLLGYRQREGSAMHSDVPTRVMSGEIRCRVELVQMMDASGKIVPGLAASNWITGYFFPSDSYRQIRGRSPEDVKLLTGLWLDALRFFSSRRDMPLARRFKCWLCCHLPYRTVWDLVCVCIPYLRYELPILSPARRLWRRLAHRGEFASPGSLRRQVI